MTKLNLLEKVKDHPIRSAFLTGASGLLLATIPNVLPKSLQAGLAIIAIAAIGLVIADAVLRPLLQGWLARKGKAWHERWGDGENAVAELNVTPEQEEEVVETKPVPLQEADVPLAEVARRVFHTKKPWPETSEGKRTLVRWVNQEIANKIVAYSLTVVGNLGRMPHEVLPGWRLKNAIVDIGKEEIRLMTDWKAVEYRNILFMREEVDKIWPPIRHEEVQAEKATDTEV